VARPDLPLPSDRVWTDPEKLAPYARDEASTGKLPLAVAFPVDASEVAAVMRWASAHRVPVIPRGAGSGLSGAAVPLADAVVLSLEKMNRILSIDPENMTATVEPGVITGDIRRAAAAAGLLYAPIPASLDFCTIGGNVATNAGGLCAVKYGVTREHVLGLEAVLPTGETIVTGGALAKNSTAYNLTQLLCGSEGTLAVIVKIILKLLPLPAETVTMLAPFDSVDALAKAVVTVVSGKVIPATMELLPRAAVRCVLAKHPEYSYPFPEKVASLLLELDGMDANLVAEQATAVAAILQAHGAGEPVVATTPARRAELWTLRKQVRDSIAHTAPYVEADAVVPRAKLPDLVRAADAAGVAAGLEQITYGHAGDGNLHTYFWRGTHDDVAWARASEIALTHLFTATVALGGTLSGEHGLGHLKRDYLPLALAPETIALMKRLKAAFDPAGILNPHKVFP